LTKTIHAYITQNRHTIDKPQTHTHARINTHMHIFLIAYVSEIMVLLTLS